MTSADEAAEGAENAAEGPAAADAAEAADPAGTEPEAAAEGVEIPKQQRAEEAADNEAGESARK
ncbi:gliding motility protein [Streptomyces lavendulocolor]|uniref:gliding motility protein n=1 Tax=Streptomyces lavendulocolor TaxID=67316 RepID=UPI003C2CD226